MDSKKILFLCVVLILVPACGSKQRSQSRRYEKALSLYQETVREYAYELELCATQGMKDQAEIRRCVLSHVDQTRHNLSWSHRNRYDWYASYPFLAYAEDVYTTIGTLNAALRAIVVYDTPASIELCQQMQALRASLQEYRRQVICHDRYLVEQDKWDKARLAQAQQASINAALAQAQQSVDKAVAQSKQAPVVREVHVYHNTSSESGNL